MAEYFGKQHMHVLRDIDALIESAPEASSNFGLCPYQAVAEFFGKEHFNVLRDIRNLEMPSDLKASFFQPVLAGIRGLTAQLTTENSAVWFQPTTFRQKTRFGYRDIRKLSAELSPEISGVWFQPTTFRQKTRFGYRDMPAFDMTRDGFTLLAMGFVQFWTMPLSGRGRVLWERASKRSCGR